MKTRFIALAGLAIVAAACNKENVPQVNENGRVTVSFNANTVDTKVVYTEDAAGEYYNINWSPNEEVGLSYLGNYYTGPENYPFKFKQDHGNVFTGEVTPWEGSRTVCAFWPYESLERLSRPACDGFFFDCFFHTYTPLSIPAGSEEYGHTLLVAVGHDRTYDHIGNLEFHQAYAIVKMNITGVPSDAKVEKVKVESSGQIVYEYQTPWGGTSTLHNSLQLNGYINLYTGSSLVDYTFYDCGVPIPGLIIDSCDSVESTISGTENGQDCVINLPLAETKSLMECINESGDTYIFTVTLSNGDTYAKTLSNKAIFEMGHVYKLNMPLQDLGVKDLSADGTANCYVVNKYGPCKFDATKKGHTSESVGTIASAEVLWESFGDDVQPAVGDIVSNVSVENGIVSFTASGKDGNAVIAVKDAAGEILWSWHIWVCKDFDPVATAQVYNNNAGTMMDRNLGATSATKGDVHALGLMYQWGRKDPFLGGQSISYSSSYTQTKAKSTITWPSTVSSDSSNGTIDFVVKHPTTFVTKNSNNYDWYYTGSSSTDNTRWNSSKGMYDPCPKGWKVPDGGSNGLWAKAFGTSSPWTTSSNWDSTNKGMDFGSTDKKLGSGEIWYPASGYLINYDGALYYVGNYGLYWSCAPNGYRAYDLGFYSGGSVTPSDSNRADGLSVRCLAE